MCNVKDCWVHFRGGRYGTQIQFSFWCYTNFEILGEYFPSVTLTMPICFIWEIVRGCLTLWKLDFYLEFTGILWPFYSVPLFVSCRLLMLTQMSKRKRCRKPGKWKLAWTLPRVGITDVWVFSWQGQRFGIWFGLRSFRWTGGCICQHLADIFFSCYYYSLLLWWCNVRFKSKATLLLRCGLNTGNGDDYYFTIFDRLVT